MLLLQIPHVQIGEVPRNGLEVVDHEVLAAVHILGLHRIEHIAYL